MFDLHLFDSTGAFSLNYNALIQDIVDLSQQIEDLAQSDDWLSMQNLADRRMRGLHTLFAALALDQPVQLSVLDCKKLNHVLNANQRILAHTRRRRDAVVMAVSTQRAATAAQRAYTACPQY